MVEKDTDCHFVVETDTNLLIFSFRFFHLFHSVLIELVIDSLLL